MTTPLTQRILAGEIVLTKDGDEFAVSALAKKIEGESIAFPGETFLRDVIIASKKDGSTVRVQPTHIVGRTEVDGHAIIKATVTILPEVATQTPRITLPAANGACRCGGDADTHGRCYQCGGYQRHSDVMAGL